MGRLRIVRTIDRLLQKLFMLLKLTDSSTKFMSLSRAWSSLSRKSSISSVVSLDADAAIIARNGMKRALLMELSKIAQEAKVDGARALVHLDEIFPGAIREVNELVRTYSQKETK